MTLSVLTNSLIVSNIIGSGDSQEGHSYFTKVFVIKSGFDLFLEIITGYNATAESANELDKGSSFKANFRASSKPGNYSSLRLKLLFLVTIFPLSPCYFQGD